MILLPVLIESNKVEKATEVLHFYRLVHLFSLGIHWSTNICSIYGTLVKFVFALWTPLVCASLFSIICVLGNNTNTFFFFFNLLTFF